MFAKVADPTDGAGSKTTQLIFYTTQKQIIYALTRSGRHFRRVLTRPFYYIFSRAHIKRQNAHRIYSFVFISFIIAIMCARDCGFSDYPRPLISYNSIYYVREHGVRAR